MRKDPHTSLPIKEKITELEQVCRVFNVPRRPLDVS